MTGYLKAVFNTKLSKDSFQGYFCDELLELINDEDLLVRIEALDVAVEIMQSKLTTDQIDKDLLPSFCRHLEIEQEEECDIKMSALLGKFLFNLPLEKQRKTNQRAFIDFFNRACRSQNIIVRTNAAINLPCFYYYFGNIDDPELDFTEIFAEFSQDENIEIKEIVAKGIHEVLELLEKQGKNPFMLEDAYFNLLKTSGSNPITVQLALSQNIGASFGTFLRAFSLELLNIGSTFETFIDTTLKNEKAGDLVELY